MLKAATVSTTAASRKSKRTILVLLASGTVVLLLACSYGFLVPYYGKNGIEMPVASRGFATNANKTSRVRSPFATIDNNMTVRDGEQGSKGETNPTVHGAISTAKARNGIEECIWDADCSSGAAEASCVDAGLPLWNCTSKVPASDCSIHPPPVPKERIPFHLHVRKSGGSYLCDIAFKVNPRGFEDPQGARARGCNMLGDGPMTMHLGVDSNTHMPNGISTVTGAFSNRGWCCSDRYEYALKHQPGLIAREAFASGPPCPEYFKHSIILRDPLARIISGMQQSGDNWDHVFSSLTHDARKPPHEHMAANLLVSWPMCHGTVSYNNFYVRSILGEAAFLLPLGALNTTHLAAAKAILDEYAVVIVLEDFERQMVQLETEFGWSLTSAARKADKRTYRKARINPTLKELNFLRDHNQLDIALYEYAAGLAAELTKSAMERKSSNVSARLILAD